MPKNNKCAYNGCGNCARTSSKLSFHRFPLDDERCKKWIVRAGRNEWLQMEPQKLHDQRICSAHFETTDFKCNHPKGKPMLNSDALPAVSTFSSKLVRLQSSPEPTTPIQSAESLVSETVDVSRSRDIAAEPRKKPHFSRRELILMKKLATATSRLKKSRQEVRNLKRKNIKKLSVPDIIEGAAHHVTGDRLLLLKMQLEHIKVAPWSEKEKQYALGLFYKSPKGYVYLRDKKDTALPCVTLIRQWVNDLNLTTGVSPELFELLKIKASTLDERERQCVLMWDEMSIKKLLEYNAKEDIIEGYEDLGHLGRTDKPAKYALTFMLRGLTSSWKQPIAFYVSHGNVAGVQLQELITTVVGAAFGAGFVVRSMVCDQGSPNRRAINAMGINEDKPFVMLSGHKIFFNYDVPHLFKSIRNNMLSKDFIIANSRISWSAIRELHNAQRSKACKAAPKLTDRHIDPNGFQRMTVRYATQVFSASVSAAMTTGRITGDLQNPFNIATSNFVKKMNDIFDCLNSRFANDPNPLKRALSDKSPQVQECLEKALPWLDQWTVSGGPNPPCFSGLKMAIKSVLMFWSDLRAEGNLYLLTTRLNQDPLENQFGVLRSRSGHNDNPSAKQFKHNLQYVITTDLETLPRGTNCEEDGTVMLLAKKAKLKTDFVNDESGSLVLGDNAIKENDSTNVRAADDLIDQIVENVDDVSDGTVPTPTETNESSEVTLEKCTMNYVAGYLLHKCLKKFECSDCKDLFVQSNQSFENNNQLLSFFKAYKTADGHELGHLTAPVDKFHTLIVAAYRRFQKEFSIHSHEVGIAKYLKRCIHETLTATDSDFWLTNGDCQAHRDFIVDLFVRTHIYNYLKWISRDMRDAGNKRSHSGGSAKPNRKIMKVSHS